MSDNHRDYTNGEIVVHWQPELCTHSGKCVRNLPHVFNMRMKPWIDMAGASSDEIIRVVELCPSGALSWSKAE